MVKGIFFALSACFVWGLIFVIPQFMSEFSSIEVVLGRYFFYGIISATLFLKACTAKKCKYPRAIWGKALSFSLVCTIGYYTCLVLALRYTLPAVCALIIGVSPIAIAFYGNFQQKEVAFKHLMFPSFLILAGLLIINIPHFEASSSPRNYLLGILFSILALLAWSWFVVANARFLRHYPHVHSSDWSTVMGVTTLFWTILLAIIFVFFDSSFQIEKYLVWDSALKHFLIGSMILGLFCSWIGAYLWNKASIYLPVSLAGQLTIFETIFGVLFVYIIDQTSPSLIDIIGIIILLSAVAHGTQSFVKKKAYTKQIAPH